MDSREGYINVRRSGSNIGFHIILVSSYYFKLHDVGTTNMTCVTSILVRFVLLSGHLLGNSCSLG